MNNTKNPDTNENLDKIGKSIVFGEKPYHTTDEYKNNLRIRIAWIMQKRWEDASEEWIEKIINTYTTPATEKEWEEIIESIEEKECILPFDPKDLDMFKEDMLVAWIQIWIEKIWEKRSPYFLTLWSAKKIWENKEWLRKSTLWPIELDLLQHNNQITPLLDQNEIEKVNSNPYKILMKINYSWQDDSETIPLKGSETIPLDDSKTIPLRQGRKKYDISFVVLEDSDKTPWYTLINQWLHVNKKEMNKDEFIEWFKENKEDIMIPKSIDNSLE